MADLADLSFDLSDLMSIISLSHIEDPPSTEAGKLLKRELYLQNFFSTIANENITSVFSFRDSSHTCCGYVIKDQPHSLFFSFIPTRAGKEQVQVVLNYEFKSIDWFIRVIHKHYKHGYKNIF